MSDRTHSEHQINLLETWSGREFENALSRVLLRYADHLDFYTDDQLAEIREQMIRDAWFTHRLNRENRKRLASKGAA